MTNAEFLAATVELYEKLPQATWDGAAFKGRLLFARTMIPLLETLDLAASLRVTFDGRSHLVNRLGDLVPEGATIEVEVDPPQLDDAFFARDLDEMINAFTFTYEAPAAFYLAESRYRFPEHVPHGDVRKYLGTLDLISLLRAVADHEQRQGRSLWVILLRAEGKLEIPIAYSAADLVDLQDGWQQVSDVVAAPNETVKRGIFRNALAEVTVAGEPRERFRLLLRQFRELRQKYVDNLELYLAEFSFETEKEKIEQQKREYMLKLNGAIGDIHTKLIAIPAAVVLVGGQMKPVDSAAALVSNGVILLGALVFAILMFMTTANQRHSLEALRSEYQRRRSRLQAEIPGLFSEIADAFEQLEKRYQHQNSLLRWINRLLVGGLICSIGVFTFYTVQQKRGTDPRRPATETTRSPVNPPASAHDSMPTGARKSAPASK